MPGPCRAFPCSRAPSAAPAPAALAPPPSYAPPEKPRIWSLARTAGANAARRGSPEGCGTEEGGGAVGELPPAPEAPFRSSASAPNPSRGAARPTAAWGSRASTRRPKASGGAAGEAREVPSRAERA